MNNKNTLQTIFMFALFGLFFVLLVCMLFPFANVILWTALFYVIFHPLYEKCEGHLNPQKKFYSFKRNLLAGGFAIGILVLIIGPLTGICFLLIQQLTSFISSIEQYFTANPEILSSSGIIKWLTDFCASINFDLPEIDINNITEAVVSFVKSSSSKLFSAGKTIMSSAGGFIVSLFFITFALYFCFLDGKYLVSLIKKAIPINPQNMNVIAKKFSTITRNLFSGYILVALYQGAAAFVLMLIFRVQGALLFSFVLMFASFVPIFGAALVWVPIGVVICLTDSLIKGILFLILAGICISFLDNFLRPFFLKDRINVHPLIIFFSILGGLQIFGMNGLILGPLVIILFFTVLDLLTHQNIKNKKTNSLDSKETESTTEPEIIQKS